MKLDVVLIDEVFSRALCRYSLPPLAMVVTTSANAEMRFYPALLKSHKFADTQLISVSVIQEFVFAVVEH